MYSREGQAESGRLGGMKGVRHRVFFIGRGSLFVVGTTRPCGAPLKGDDGQVAVWAVIEAASMNLPLSR
jgi:hypothetical protein